MTESDMAIHCGAFGAFGPFGLVQVVRIGSHVDVKSDLFVHLLVNAHTPKP